MGEDTEASSIGRTRHRSSGGGGGGGGTGGGAGSGLPRALGRLMRRFSLGRRLLSAGGSRQDQLYEVPWSTRSTGGRSCSRASSEVRSYVSRGIPSLSPQLICSSPHAVLVRARRQRRWRGASFPAAVGRPRQPSMAAQHGADLVGSGPRRHERRVGLVRLRAPRKRLLPVVLSTE